MQQYGSAMTETSATAAFRNTKQRQLIRAALTGCDSFLSAQQLHERLRDQGHRIGLATVYRALQAMVEAHEVDSLRNPDGEAVYRRCSAGHHHHLICRRCGRTVEVGELPVVDWAEQLATEHGFTEVEHVVEVYGLCAVCSSSPTDAPMVTVRPG